MPSIDRYFRFAPCAVAYACIRSGFYAWVKNPLSLRAHEDACQTKLLKVAWKDSGKIYGDRKLRPLGRLLCNRLPGNGCRADNQPT